MANMSVTDSGALFNALRTMRQVEGNLKDRDLAVAVAALNQCLNKILSRRGYGVGDGKPMEWVVTIRLPGDRRVRR